MKNAVSMGFLAYPRHVFRESRLLLMNIFGASASALDENGDGGGGNPGGSGGLSEYWSSSWCGMRITVIDVTDPAREIDGEQ